MTSSLRVSVPDETWEEPLADTGAEVVVWDVSSPQPDERLDLVVLPYSLDMALLSGIDTSRIGALQGQALGFDHIADALPAGATYSNAVGVHEESTAEMAMALALSSARHMDDFARERGQWNARWGTSLGDGRILLLGIGGIGSQIEKRVAGFGSEIVRVGSHARDDGAARVYGIDELAGLLPTATTVFVAVPLKASTSKLLDDAFFALLPDNALVVNVSRGQVADTDAVVRATRSGRIRYATDVTDPEPLPAHHPLWSATGVIVSPHVGGMSTLMRPRIEALVRDQLVRIARGDLPTFVVIGAEPSLRPKRSTTLL